MRRAAFGRASRPGSVPLRPLVLAFPFLLGILGATAARAEGAAEAASVVSLRRAVELAAARHPATLEASRARAAAAAFDDAPGSSLPSLPQATIVAGTRAPAGAPAGPEVVLTVQQELALRRLGRAREVAARSVLRAAGAELEQARSLAALDAALAWIALAEAEALLRVRGGALAEAETLERLAEARVVSGAATSAERSLARAEVGATRLGLLEAEGAGTEARLALAHACGLAYEAPVVTDGGLARLASEGARPVGSVDVDAAPSVAAARAEAASAAAQVDVVRATLGPTIGLGATAWREATGDRAVAAIVTLPLPFFEPARHDVARQAVVASAAGGRAARVRADLARDVRLAEHERAHAREVHARVESDLVEPLRRALETTMTAYRAGTTELSLVVLARRSALAADERHVASLADVWRADVRAAALSGALVRRGVP